MQCDNFLCEGKDLIAVSNTFCIAWYIFHSSIPWSGEVGLPEITHLQNELMHMWTSSLWENQNFCQPEIWSNWISWGGLLCCPSLWQGASVHSVAIASGYEVSACICCQCFLSGLEHAPMRGSMVSKSTHSVTNLLTCLIEKHNWSGWHPRPKQESKRNIWVVLISVSARVPWLSRKKLWGIPSSIALLQCCLYGKLAS